MNNEIVLPDIGDYSATQACAVLNITKPTLLKLVKAGKVPGYQVGNQVRIKREVMNQIRDGILKIA